ncbi:MAG: GDSL-type esterase/lipase family protein [Bacteriovoracia bacterium]
MRLAIIALVTLFAPTLLFADEKFDRETVIFIGSSTMGHWKPRMDKDFLPIKTWNFGENGTDFHYLHETVPDWSKKFPAKRWVIYSGDNDLNSTPRRTPEQVNADMLKTVDLIRENDPDAEIFVISIKCRVYVEAEPACPRVMETNKLMAESALKVKGLTYVDTFSAMRAADDDQRKFFDEDGVHLNDKGYDIWAGTLKPLLQKSIGNTAAVAKKKAPRPSENEVSEEAVRTAQ